MSRLLVVGLGLLALAACNDLRDFRGAWSGPRVGEAMPLRLGVADDAEALLVIESLDRHGLRGHLTVDRLTDGDVESLAGAEADVLAGMTFAGSPLRVYLAFVPVSDGGGDLLAVIALYADDRVEVRLLRGGAQPVYAVFDLTAA